MILTWNQTELRKLHAYIRSAGALEGDSLDSVTSREGKL